MLDGNTEDRPTVNENYTSALSTGNTRLEAHRTTCKKCGGIEFDSEGRCLPCRRSYQAAWRAANVEKYRASNAAYRASNREQVLQKKREHWEKNKDHLNAERRAQRSINPEPLRTRQKARYHANYHLIRQQRAAHYARNRLRILERNRRWRSENREILYASVARYRAAHPEVPRCARAKWAENNPDMVRTKERKRRGLTLNGRISRNLPRKLYALQRGKCPCCGLPLGTKFHLDHIVPLALGGEHADHNMQLLRDVCNLQKSKKHPVDFMRSRGFLL